MKTRTSPPIYSRLPYSIRILLESVLRNCDGFEVTEADVAKLAGWKSVDPKREELPFKPGRLLLQDFAGVPCVVDLAAIREAVKRLGGDPARVNPLVPVDLVVDHSLQVDSAGSADSIGINMRKEFERNRERYQFLRWGQQAFRNLRVIPPATGILHQLNLEYLASVVASRPGKAGQPPTAMPDTLVGTDSHTTMINGLGVLGWGVGGIEAEAVMLGRPMSFLAPDVIGVKLIGAPREGVTATDMVLTLVQILRRKGVVEKFVEFFGPALPALPVPGSGDAGQYGAGIRGDLRFLPGGCGNDCASCGSPAARRSGMSASSGIARRRTCFADRTRPNRNSPPPSNSIFPRWSPRSPARVGRRTAFRWRNPSMRSRPR